MSDAFETHLKVITSAGERTRGILYFLGIATAALLAVVWESDIVPMRDIRHEKISKAFLCYANDRSKDEDVPANGEKNKTSPSEKCGPYYDYAEAFFIYLKPPPPIATPNTAPEEVKQALTKYYLTSWDAIAERYKSLMREYTEGAAFPLPIIGIKVDRNNIFLFSSVSMMFIMFFLYLSLESEIKCANDVEHLKIIDEEWKALALVNTHVFAKSTNSKYFWMFLFFPFCLIVADVGVSVWQTFGRYWKSLTLPDFSQRPLQQWGWYLAQLACILLLAFVTYMCYNAARKLDGKLSELVKKAEDLQPRGL